MEKVFKFLYDFMNMDDTSPLPMNSEGPNDEIDSEDNKDVPSCKEVQKQLELGLTKKSIHVHTRIVDSDRIFHNAMSDLLTSSNPGMIADESFIGSDKNPQKSEGKTSDSEQKGLQPDETMKTFENNSVAIDRKKKICFQTSLMVSTMIIALIWDFIAEDGNDSIT